MQGTIIANSSGRKLSILVTLLIITQIGCFLIGGLGTACQDIRKNGTEPGDGKWFYPRGNGACTPINSIHPFSHDDRYQADQVVYTFSMPAPHNGRRLDFSRWQQYLIGVLQVDITYASEIQVAPKTKMTLDARLAYRNKGDAEDDWKPYASSVVERNLECTINTKIEEYNYNCSPVPLFALGSLHHDFYLLNLRLPADTDKNINQGLSHVNDLWLTTGWLNGEFTKVWMSLKTICFPIIICFLVWYWRRVRMLSREPALLEYMLMALGLALTFLNVPLEYFTLAYDLPFMPLLGDIMQGIFYATLLAFWLVFAGEHLMIQDNEQRSSLKCYWRQLSVVGVGFLLFFIFVMFAGGVQLHNPFYLNWFTDVGTKLDVAFTILACISAGLYLLFLTYMIWKVFMNISVKRTGLPSIPSASAARRLHYEGIVYRFKFIMITTLMCASLTIVEFILRQVAVDQWKWDEGMELEFMSSAFITDVYGMWNIYILALICLYAPSHKQWPSVEPLSK